MFFIRKGIISTVLLLFALTSELFADGSIYSLRGQGLLLYFQGGRATGMGGATLGVSDPLQLNWFNPASLAMIDRVRFSAQFLHQNLDIQDQDVNYKTNYTNFNGFYAGFSVASGVGLGFGLQPISKINYTFESRAEIDNFDYTRTIQRLGGLNRAYVVTGVKIFSGLQLGVNFGYVFGKSDENWRVDYVDPSFAFTLDQFRNKYKGLSARLGTVLNPAKGLSIGGVFETKYDLTRNSEFIHVRPRTVTTSSLKLDVPALWGVGIAYSYKEKFLWAADFVTQDWQGHAAGDANNASEFTQYQRLSLGFEFQPSVERSAKSWKNVQFRLGFAWEQHHILDYSGETLSTLLLTAGIGFPFGGGSGSFDFAFEYGQRGSLSDNTFKERIMRFSIYVSGSELWFQR